MATPVAQGRRDGSVTAVPLPVPRASSSGAGPGPTRWSAAGRRSWLPPSGTASGAARLAWRSWRTARSHLRCSRYAGAPMSPLGGEGDLRAPRGGSVTPPASSPGRCWAPSPPCPRAAPRRTPWPIRGTQGQPSSTRQGHLGAPWWPQGWAELSVTVVVLGLGMARGHCGGCRSWAMTGGCCGSPSGDIELGMAGDTAVALGAGHGQGTP